MIPIPEEVTEDNLPDSEPYGRLQIQEVVQNVQLEFEQTGLRVKSIRISPQIAQSIYGDQAPNVDFECFGVHMIVDAGLSNLDVAGVPVEETLLNRRQVCSAIGDAVEIVEDSYKVARIVVGDLMGRSIMAVLATRDKPGEPRVRNGLVLGYPYTVDNTLPPDYVLVYPCQDPNIESLNQGEPTEE